MAKKRIYACWLLLLILLFMTGVMVATGEAHARYTNTATAVAVMETPEIGVTSNCLVTAKDAPLTVLLGELGYFDVIRIPFWMLSSGQDVLEVLSWGVQNPDHEQYLSISILAGHEILKSEKDLELLEDIKMELILRIAPTEYARTNPHEAMKINVHVTWGKEMWGTFQVILPPVLDPEELAAEESIEPTGEVSTGIATETPIEPEIEPETETTADSTTETGEEPATQPMTNPATDTVEGTQTEPTTEPATGPPTEPAEEFTQEQLQQEAEETLMELLTISSFHPTEKLPVLMELAEHITSVRLGVQNSYGDIKMTEPLPNYTMFSLDGGVSYYMVYGRYLPEFGLQQVLTLPVMMDFSRAQLNGAEEMTLVMETYQAEEFRRSATATIRINPEQSGQAVIRSQNTQNTDESQQVLAPILTRENALEFRFPVDWKDAKLEYSVWFLTMTEDQKLKYERVTLSRDELYETYYLDENTHKLVLRLGQKFAKPGTYQIRITWNYKGVCYSNTQTTFFVNYTDQSEAELGS